MNFPIDNKLQSKRTSEKMHTPDSLSSRTIQHQKRLMLATEWSEWLKITFRIILIIFFIGISFKTIFYDDKIEKIITAFTTLEGDVWRTQAMYAIVIISYFVSKIFRK